MNNLFSEKQFKKSPVVAILRGISSTETTLKLAETYLKSGFSTMEITMNTENVLTTINALQTNFPELNIGAGTVCTLEDYKKATQNGAQFIVTPIINEEVIKTAVHQNVPIFPGAYTPTEIYNAWSLGATAVKVFPATQLGPTYIKDVLAPLDNLKLIPTGGVSLQNIKSFFKSGSYGVGMGGNLINKNHVLNHDFKKISAHLKLIKDEIEEFL